MPKISVIIPVYNVEKYLAQCLDSVINQTLKDIEIICINDGSPDNSLQILVEYAKKDERIKIINRPNGGLSAARNSGIEAATGTYCYFLDSDDWIELDTIEKLFNIITKNDDVDVVVHNVKIVAEDDSCIATTKENQQWFNSYIQSNGIYEIPTEINRYITSIACGKLYKMEIINQYHCRFPEGLINEDEAFLWIYMVHCRNYYYLDEKLYNYLRRADSIMSTRDKSPKVLDILDIGKIVYETVKQYKNIDDYQKYLTHLYIDTAKGMFARMPKKYRSEALKKIKEYYDNTNHSKEILIFYQKHKYKHLFQFIKGIFSIKNSQDKRHKIIKILGLKLKIKRKKKNA